MKEVAIALSGSGFRLACHVGALEAIVEANYTITEVCGTSGGSIIATALAVGFTPQAMLHMIHDTPFQSFITPEFFNIIEHQALNSGNSLLSWLTKYFGATTFNTAKLPLHVVTTDLNIGDVFVFNRTNTPNDLVAVACRASSSLPAVFNPVVLGSRFLVDGGVCDDLPVNHLDKSKLKIAISLDENDPMLDSNSSILDMLERVIEVSMSSTDEAHMDDVSNCIPIKVVTPPGLTLATNMTSDQVDQLYNIGYNTTKAVLSNL